MNLTMTALYVGDLHSDVTESILFGKFSPAGPIRSVRLCRDRNTGSSLGYAYVNFHRRADAERAMEKLNFQLLLGQPMRIMWYQMDSSVRNTGVGNLFLKNLDKSVDNKALFDTFSAFGKILSCKVVGYENGSKGYGYVHFESAEAANLAMEKLNGKLLNDRKLFIEPFKSREERMAEMGSCSQVVTNIYIKNFGEDMDNKKLKETFSKFGPVVSARVMTDETGISRRFGFVRFQKHEDAQRAVDEMNGKELDGMKLYVGQAQHKVERQAELTQKYEQGLNLYVKNLNSSVDDDCLHSVFSQYGAIINAKVMMENGHSKCFGFVRFSSPEEAMSAIKGMNGRKWGRKTLYVGVAQRKDERQAYLAQRMESTQTQNQALNNANIQPVEMTFPFCKAQTIQPQDVHHILNIQDMPDVIELATRHQLTFGTTIPTTSQLTCIGEVCTNTTAPTAGDSISVAYTVPAVDIVPGVDTVTAVGTDPAPSDDALPEPAPAGVPRPPPAAVVFPVPFVDAAPETVPVIKSLPLAAAEVPVSADDAVPETARDEAPVMDDDASPEPSTVPSLPPSTVEVPVSVEAPGPQWAAVEDPAPEAAAAEEDELAGKSLTLYMLESILEDGQQIQQMAYYYMLPLVRKIHPVLASKITWMLVEGESKHRIINMIRDPELLHSKVDDMETLLMASCLQDVSTEDFL